MDAAGREGLGQRGFGLLLFVTFCFFYLFSPTVNDRKNRPDFYVSLLKVPG